MNQPTTIWSNFTHTKAGSVKAICHCCGKNSSPVPADHEGEPSMWHLGRGWSVAGFPADHKHDDGSVGSFFTCPSCNKQLYAGKTLKRRNYTPAKAVQHD